LRNEFTRFDLDQSREKSMMRQGNIDVSKMFVDLSYQPKRMVLSRYVFTPSGLIVKILILVTVRIFVILRIAQQHRAISNILIANLQIAELASFEAKSVLRALTNHEQMHLGFPPGPSELVLSQ
jgi:hypothetical protein